MVSYSQSRLHSKLPCPISSFVICTCLAQLHFWLSSVCPLLCTCATELADSISVFSYDLKQTLIPSDSPTFLYPIYSFTYLENLNFNTFPILSL